MAPFELPHPTGNKCSLCRYKLKLFAFLSRIFVMLHTHMHPQNSFPCKDEVAYFALVNILFLHVHTQLDLWLIVKSHSLHFILTMVLSSVCPKILQFAIFLGKGGGKMAAGGLRSPAQQGEGVLHHLLCDGQAEVGEAGDREPGGREDAGRFRDRDPAISHRDLATSPNPRMQVLGYLHRCSTLFTFYVV